LTDTTFKELETTSIFAKDRRAVDPNGPLVDTSPIITVPPPQSAFRGDAPIFRGVVEDKNGIQGLLEVQKQDPVTHNVMPSTEYIRKGETITWNNSQVVDLSMDGLTVIRGGKNVLIPLGYNVENQPASLLSSVAAYVSQDALGVQNNQNNNNNGFGGGRNGRGGGGFGAGGGGGGFGAGGVGGGRNGGVGFGAGIAQAIVSVQLDPPLPPGSADDLEARMRARRDAQTGGASAPVVVPTTPIITTPTGTPVAPATPATPTPAAPATPAPAGG
jgi:hypothetical protein